MPALQSLSTAVSTLRSHPVILLGALLFALAGELLVFAQLAVGPTAANLITVPWFFVWPFLLAGFIGMVAAGLPAVADLNVTPGLDVFRREGRANYVPVLVGTIAFTVLFVAAGVVVAILAIGAGVGLTGSGYVGDAALAVGLAFAGFSLLLFGLLYLVFQFYDAAIVVDDAGGIDSLGASARLVRDNPATVFGYTLLFVAISAVGQAPGLGIFFLAVEFTEAGGMAIADVRLLAVSTVLSLVLGTVTYALVYTYHVAFYVAMTADPISKSVADPRTSDPASEA